MELPLIVNMIYCTEPLPRFTADDLWNCRHVCVAVCCLLLGYILLDDMEQCIRAADMGHAAVMPANCLVLNCFSKWR